MFLVQHAKWDIVFVTFHDGEYHKFSLCGIVVLRQNLLAALGNRKLTNKWYFMSIIECYKQFRKLLLKIEHGFRQINAIASTRIIAWLLA